MGIRPIFDNFATNTETGEKTEMIEDSPGDIIFAATWQPDIRFWRNVHLFLGPTISTNTIGLHLSLPLQK